MLQTVRNILPAIIPFSDDELRLFTEKLHPLTVKEGELLVKKGDHCREMYLIISGSFRLYTINDKAEFTVDFYFFRDWVGDYESCLSGNPAINHVEALEDSHVASLSLADQYCLYEAGKNFERLGRLIAEQLFLETTSRNKQLFMLSAAERYTALIQKRPEILQKVPQKYIASYLGIKPQSLSRIRAQALR